MPRVFLDCDEVLADFRKAATAALGQPPNRFRQQFGSEQLWRRLAAVPDFFAELDLLPDAMDLYRAVRHLKPSILTRIPFGDWAEPQKRRWAERYFPGVPVITTPTAALKAQHCRPGDALVDDRDKYRHLWEKAGGIFIRHTSATASIAALRSNGFEVEGIGVNQIPIRI
jgi:hypothetical protein